MKQQGTKKAQDFDPRLCASKTHNYENIHSMKGKFWLH